MVERERVRWATGGSHTLGGLRGAPLGVGMLNWTSGMIGLVATLGACSGTRGGGTGGFCVIALMLDLVTRDGDVITGSGGWIGCGLWGTYLG